MKRSHYLKFILLLLFVATFSMAQTVYTTKTGSKYHSDGCRHLRQSQYSISLQSAINSGYTPCSVCGPPTEVIQHKEKSHTVKKKPVTKSEPKVIATENKTSEINDEYNYHPKTNSTPEVVLDASGDTALVNALNRQKKSYNSRTDIPSTTMEPVISEEIYTVVEKMPEYPGGAMEMMKYIKKNLQYPASAREAGISGKCFLKFVINGEGDIKDIIVLKPVARCPDCDTEAIRVVQSMPKWKAGTQNGKPVSVFFNLPVNFTIN
jgi:TonB family protein